MTTALMDLKINHDLIDSNFDGYKLSLDPLPVYRVALESGINEVKLHEDQYSYQHVKAFGTHNHLSNDPHYAGLFYYIDVTWNIRKYMCAATQNVTMQPPTPVYQLPDANQLQQRTNRLNATLSAASAQHMCVCDGTGNLYLFTTGDRMQDEEWKICYMGNPVTSPDSDNPIPTMLLHSTHHVVDDVPHIECIMLHVHKNPESDNENRAPAFLTTLTWLTLVPGEDKWELSCTRSLSGASTPDYCVIEQGGLAVIIASEKPFEFVYDSLHPIEKLQQVDEANGLNVAEETTYAWTQTEDDVTVFFSLPSNTAKPDIAYHLTAHTLELGIKNADAFLQGALYADVDVDGCTWTMSQEQDMKKLELHLEKVESGMWPEVIVGDKRGHLVADLEQMEEIHERLAYLTSDQLNPSPEGQEKAYNSQQLEECDAFPDTHSSLVRFDVHTHKPSHQANLSSHQWLFNAPGEDGRSPCMCVRHDVDGVIWQPVTNDDQSPWQHVATFNAFGYVQASKQQKKYCSCAPNFSFVIICDCVRHIYIYRQPLAISSPLRNRKTGREVSALAKQQLVSLDSVDNIMGLQVENDKVYVLAGRTLFMIKIIADTE